MTIKNQTGAVLESLKKHLKENVLNDIEITMVDDIDKDIIKSFQKPKEYEEAAESEKGTKLPVLFVGFVSSSYTPLEIGNNANIENISVTFILYHPNEISALSIMNTIRSAIFGKEFTVYDFDNSEMGTAVGNNDFFDFERVDSEVFIELNLPMLVTLVGNTSIDFTYE